MPLNSIIHLSDAALIAVHALAGLAARPEELVQGRDLSDKIGASGNHLAKVMQRLVKTGLARSVKGPSGGFALARPAADISFKDAIEAIDGPLSGDFCPFSAGTCSPLQCIFGGELSSHANDLIDYLGSRTIADIGAGGKMSPSEN